MPSAATFDALRLEEEERDKEDEDEDARRDRRTDEARRVPVEVLRCEGCAQPYLAWEDACWTCGATFEATAARKRPALVLGADLLEGGVRVGADWLCAACDADCLSFEPQCWRCNTRRGPPDLEELRI